MLPYMKKKDLADVIKLRILRWGDYPRLPRRAQCNHKCHFKRDKRRFYNRRGRRQCDNRSKGRKVDDVMQGRGHKLRQLPDAGKSKDMGSPPELPNKPALGMLVQIHFSLLASNCEKINVYYFKRLSL